MKRTIKTMLVAALAAVSYAAAHAQGSNEDAVLQNIMTRCSIRKFQQKDVAQDKVEKLLRAGMAAPSSRDMRPWHFVVVQGKGNIDKLASSNPRQGDKIRATPLIIIVCGDTTRMQEGEARDFWVEDVSAASENILLAAHAMGLGAVWTSIYPQMRKVNGYRENLGLPENLVPFNAIMIGYPDEPADVKDKWDPEQITYWTGK